MSAVIVHAGVYENLTTGTWTKCVAKATKLENIMVNAHKVKWTYTKLNSKMSYYKKSLKTSGEMGVLRSIISVKYRIEDQGVIFILLSYTHNNIEGTHQIFNICTKCIVSNCEAKWLNKTYDEYVSRKEQTKSDRYILQD